MRFAAASRFALSATTLLLVIGSSVTALAGPKITVGRAVPRANRVAIEQVDHRLWDSLLKKHVDKSGRVNYQAWKRSARDQALLDQYLAQLSAVNLQAPRSREASLAFWINAYNAVTIKGILREYPTTSIRNHTAQLYGYNIWHDLLLEVGDVKISLHSIEHNILRKSNEPRIHFAIVCASLGCPRLRNEAFTAKGLERQLSENTKEFFANPKNFQRQANGFAVSPILKWFATDFGADRAAQLRYLAPYLPDTGSQLNARSGAATLTYLKYDWALNDQAR